MAFLFISDLHLCKERPDISQAFHTFLQTTAVDSDALYILGDLFEVWLGDDIIFPEYQSSIHQLKKLHDTGVPIYVMRGNRDFLYGESFESLTGTTLIDDPTTIDLYGEATLLMHGDTLCTDDTAYQDFRKIVRNADFQADFLNKSAQQRIEIARHMRAKSKSETSLKSEDIMDVNNQAVLKVLSENNVQRLIHGHTHRPAVHEFVCNNKPASRIVLADWHQQGNVLIRDQSGYQTKSITIVD